jgi:lysophospholipase
MAYTASALSFMIENLKKTIVITGSQIPIGSVRNDAVNNLLSSLTIAGHYVIPEVLVVFDNKIFRGNRSTKFSTSSFDSFKSPNFCLLG